MCARGRVGNRRPAGDFRDCAVCEDEYSCEAGVTAAGEQHSFRLPPQGGHGDLLYSPLLCGADGGVNTPQVHVRRHDEGHTLEKGVPGGNIFRRRLVLMFQRRLGQPGSVIRHGHDLQLYRAGGVTGEQMYRQLQGAVSIAVEDQPRIGLVGLRKLSENIRVTLPSKDERPPGIPETGGLIGEGSQFIRKGQLTDAGANVVDSVESPTQIGNGGNADIPPRVHFIPSCDGREKERWGLRQFLVTG